LLSGKEPISQIPKEADDLPTPASRSRPSSGVNARASKGHSRTAQPGSSPTSFILSFRTATHPTILGVSCGRIACLPRTARPWSNPLRLYNRGYEIRGNGEGKETERERGEKKLTLLILFKAIFLQVRFRLCFWLIRGFVGLLFRSIFDVYYSISQWIVEYVEVVGADVRVRGRNEMVMVMNNKIPRMNSDDELRIVQTDIVRFEDHTNPHSI
jgi:hypothetical protein